MAFTPSENPITHPTRESYTELRPFRFWCQKVLPLVYDDSLSYYELLCKVVDYLNKTMEDVDHMNTDMDTLYSNFQEFQEGTIRIYNELVAYVNTYFDELDVQDEIDNKLDEMVTSGELVTVLRPTIAEEVTSWLSEHITPTSPIIDDSLTVSGAGADAKVVGEDFANTYNTNSTYNIGDYVLYNGNIYKCTTEVTEGESFDSNKWLNVNTFDEIKKFVNQYIQTSYTTDKSYDESIGNRELFDNIHYTTGRLNNSGNVYNDPDKHFTSYYIPVRGGMTVNLNFTLNDYHHRIAEYDGNYNFIAITPYSSAETLTLNADTQFIRFCAPFNELNTAQISTPEVIYNYINNVKFFTDLFERVLGYKNLEVKNLSIYDPNTLEVIGNDTNVEYDVNSEFAVACQFNPVVNKAQRLYILFVFSGSIFPNRVLGGGIYNIDNTLISTKVFTSQIHDEMNFSMSYVDLTDSDNYNVLKGLYSFGYSSGNRKLKIEKILIFTDLLDDANASDVYIDVGNDQTYKTFTSAFNFAKEFPSTNFHVKYHGNGTDYDISSENGNTDPNGLHIPENVVEIVGVRDRDNNIIIDTYNNGIGSCFWIEYGCIIRNIYFKGTGKYCIHIDDPNNKNHDSVIENCRFYHATGGSGSIGVGFQAMSNLTIQNCWFERDTDAGIRVHNWHYANQASNKLNIIGNLFSNNMVCAVHLYTVSQYNYGYPLANIIGNEFNGLNIVLSEESYPDLGSGNHWRVWGRNNSNVNVQIKHHDSDKNYSSCVEIFLPNATVEDIVL